MLAGRVARSAHHPDPPSSLELVLIGDSPEVDGMRKDVDEMSAMLEAYLAFARGDFRRGRPAHPT